MNPGRYFPDEYVGDVFTIDYAELWRKGYRAIIFDIDNTLVPHGADSTPEVDALFSRLHSDGWATLLLSNNNEARISRFNRNIGTLYIAEGGKPSPEGFRRAVEMLGAGADRTLVIGDTTWTDIAGARAVGLASILVKYIGYHRREWKGVRRNIERVLLAFYPLVKRFGKRRKLLDLQ